MKSKIRGGIYSVKQGRLGTWVRFVKSYLLDLFFSFCAFCSSRIAALQYNAMHCCICYVELHWWCCTDLEMSEIEKVVLMHHKVKSSWRGLIRRMDSLQIKVFWSASAFQNVHKFHLLFLKCEWFCRSKYSFLEAGAAASDDWKLTKFADTAATLLLHCCTAATLLLHYWVHWLRRRWELEICLLQAACSENAASSSWLSLSSPSSSSSTSLQSASSSTVCW